MRDLQRTALRRHRRYARRGATARVARTGFVAALALLALVGVGLGLLALRLSTGSPMSFGQLPERFTASLAGMIGPGWTVSVRDTAFQMEGGALALHATGLDIRNPDGGLVLRSPEALVSVDTLGLLTLRLRPRAVEFRDLHLQVVLNGNGSLSFTPSPEATGEPAVSPPPLAATVPSAAPGLGVPSPVATGVASLFEMLVGSSGLLGILDQAQVTNARMTLVDSKGKERASFRRVDAAFERTPEGGRRFDAVLDGPGGVWHLDGHARRDGEGGFKGSIRGRDAPVQDLLLLSGLSGIPATTDLKVSGEADAALVGGRLTRLAGRMESGAGVVAIQEKDTSPVPVVATSVEAAWQEDRRVLALDKVTFRAPGTRLEFSGELASPGDPGWTLTAAGRDGVLSGTLPGDAPVSLDSFAAQVSGRDGLVVESFKLRGPTLTVDLAGAIGSGGDPGSLKVTGTATKSAARSIIRLWPEAATPPIRKFFIDTLHTGTVERMTMAIDMSGADIETATAQKAIPDDSVKIEFAIRDGELGGEGLPPLAQANFSGTVTGRTTAVTAPSGRVIMPDGRGLNLTNGALTIASFWAKDSTALIAFRLDGGADALASALQSPLIKEMGSVELDPTVVKGRSDLRVSVPLALQPIPKFADLPVTIVGTINDVSVEKVFGKDRLEGANLAVSYDRGNLAIKGDGRLAGNAATIEVQQARGQNGEASLSATLDDAARARRGINLGAQLTGPLALRAALPFGKSVKPGVRIDIDLARATVDGLIPGWTKPAGRPGRVAFTLVEGQSLDLKDLTLDSGATQLRGSAALTPDGQVDKADFSTFKLSAGDDMRAQIERTGGVYRAVVRGNVGDARPFTKFLGGAPSGRGGARDKSDTRDVDLDVVLNILTGHNDEAVTGVSLKAGVRNGGLRQLQLSGRLGASNLSGQTATRAGQPEVAIRSENAGSLLRFLDFYKRMSGGALALQIGAGEGVQAGQITISNFSLKNEPALSRIIPTQSQLVTADDKTGRPRTVSIDVNEVNFSKARMDFTRNAGRLDFSNASILGAEVGFTLDGFVDFSRDKVEVSGTFLPAYALNSVIAQVPLVGPLLGGGRNGGLFGVNFRVFGQLSAPTLNVNALSALAPGPFRLFLGAGGPPDPNAPAFAPQER